MARKHQAEDTTQAQGRPDRAANGEGQVVPTGADQSDAQARDALAQMGDEAKLQLNEGGRTNDSRAQKNPPGAVHGLPQPALKGTWH
jgi:hypothetical protein